MSARSDVSSYKHNVTHVPHSRSYTRTTTGKAHTRLKLNEMQLSTLVIQLEQLVNANNHRSTMLLRMYLKGNVVDGRKKKAKTGAFILLRMFRARPFFIRAGS